jgi:hypothetical protein
MSPHQIYCLSVASVACALFGTVLLAFALSRWMSAISLSLLALEVFRDAIVTNGPLPNITGTDRHRAAAVTCSKYLTYGGLFLIVSASVLQIIALWFSDASSPKTANKAWVDNRPLASKFQSHHFPTTAVPPL